MRPKKENGGCGCANIPISLILILCGLGYWGFTRVDASKVSTFFSNSEFFFIKEQLLKNSPELASKTEKSDKTSSPRTPASKTPTSRPPINPSPSSQSFTPTKKRSSLQSSWEKKQFRGIYLSRYQITNNADETTIRERVRYYRKQGINTIIHGVWGNGCTMYPSQVMQQKFGYSSCPNQFQEKWLDWLIDEAHKQGIQVHAYFEKGIKLDQNSPIFDLAVSKRWIVPGVDKTYPGVDHYLLDVKNPEVAQFFRGILVEFVQRYPNIDAVQWDDYLGYHAELPGKIDRTHHLTKFVQQLKSDMKQANPKVSFDICHHNPYWGKRYFAADWQKWHVDRIFIQVYNDANFYQELTYAEKYAGVAISDQQLHRLGELVKNPKIKGILVFPFSGNPHEAVESVVRKLAAP